MLGLPSGLIGSSRHISQIYLFAQLAAFGISHDGFKDRFIKCQQPATKPAGLCFVLHVRQVSGKYACQRFDVGYVLAQVIFRGAKLLLKLPFKAYNSCFLSSKLLATRAVKIRPLETKISKDTLEYRHLFIAEVSRI
ncbi:hypothetical protein D3C77_437430 [compost metagenome]